MTSDFKTNFPFKSSLMQTALETRQTVKVKQRDKLRQGTFPWWCWWRYYNHGRYRHLPTINSRIWPLLMLISRRSWLLQMLELCSCEEFFGPATGRNGICWVLELVLPRGGAPEPFFVSDLMSPEWLLDDCGLHIVKLTTNLIDQSSPHCWLDWTE